MLLNIISELQIGWTVFEADTFFDGLTTDIQLDGASVERIVQIIPEPQKYMMLLFCSRHPKHWGYSEVAVLGVTYFY